MTWTGQATVKSVTPKKDTKANIYTVKAVAEAGDSFKVSYPHGQEYEYQAVTSNTEGTIQKIELTLTVEGDVFLQPGDVLNVSGHFDKNNVIKRVESS